MPYQRKLSMCEEHKFDKIHAHLDQGYHLHIQMGVMGFIYADLVSPLARKAYYGKNYDVITALIELERHLPNRSGS